MHKPTCTRPAVLQICHLNPYRNVSDQWLLGDSVLVSPVLQQGATARLAYFPAGIWHDLWSYDQPSAAAPPAHAAVRGPTVKRLIVPVGDVPLHVRGGSIVPMQREGSTTTAVRDSPITLLVALEHAGSNPAAGNARERCTAFGVSKAAEASTASVGTAGSTAPAAVDGLSVVACGQLYMDGGDSLEVPSPDGHLLARFTAAVAADLSRGLLRSIPTVEAAPVTAAVEARHSTAATSGQGAAAGFRPPELEAVVVVGLPSAAAGGADAWVVEVNGSRLPPSQVQYDARGQALRLTGLQCAMSAGLAVRWQMAPPARD